VIAFEGGEISTGSRFTNSQALAHLGHGQVLMFAQQLR
jgi:hypothetical protein